MPILDGSGAAVATSTKIVVSNPNQPVFGRINKVIIDVSMPGPKGDKGDTGDPGTAAAVSSTRAGLGTPTTGAVKLLSDSSRSLSVADGTRWNIVSEKLNPKFFGATGNYIDDDTAEIQAMATVLQAGAYRESEVEWPPGKYRITDSIDFGYESGKKIDGAGSNPYDSPSLSGTRVVLDAVNKPIFKFGGGGLYPRAIRLTNMSLAYAAQQTSSDVEAMGIQFVANDIGAELAVPHDINLENISVENACDSIGHKLTGNGSTWNTYFKGLRCINQARHGLRFANVAGSPMNHWQDIYISNTNGGTVPTGYAIEHSAGGLTIDGLDIEGWHNLAVYLYGGWYYAIQNLHFEHHTISGADPFMIDIADCPLHIRSALFALHTSPGSFTGNMALIRVWTGGSVNIDHALADMNSIAGTVLFVDGPGLDNRSVIGPDIRNSGATIARVLDGTFSAWGTENKIRQNITTPWVTPALGAGWVAVAGYQPPRYRRKGDVVEVEGLAQNTSGGSLLTAVFTLPSGFRPALYQTDIGWSGVAATPVVESTGNVLPPSPISNNGYFVTKTSFSVLP